MTDLYREPGLDVYEKVHYGTGDHIREVEDILSWYRRSNTRVLDIGCSGGLHVIEFARRGFTATGIDVEASAIERARKRCRDQGIDAVFRVRDIVDASFADLGRFDLVYSIGNVLSHVDKARALQVFKKIKTCLAMDGAFLFDLLIIGSQFSEEIREDELGIIWKRKLNPITGEIGLRGIFLDSGITEDFQVWGYGIEEVTDMLMQSGFSSIEYSDRLDFSNPGTRCAAPVCLRFRAHAKEEV
jgi:SAM-dependent methyltransferase